MFRSAFAHRLVSALLALGMVAAPVVALAQAPAAPSMVPMLVLRPHCEEQDLTNCPSFEAQDPETLLTPILAAGDTLDMDLILLNPNVQKIKSMRVWLSYDPNLLHGTSIELSSDFPTFVPGEVDFTSSSGYAKMAASAIAGNEPAAPVLKLAHLVFTVKDITAQTSPISFYDQQDTPDSHTFIGTVAAPGTNMLSQKLGTVLTRFAQNAGASGAQSATGSVVSTSSAASTSSGGPTFAAVVGTSSVSATGATATSSAPAVNLNQTFTTLQVQNVRIGTREDNLFVSWDPLSFPNLQGYNVYYGTVSGKYVQRKSLSVASRGVAIAGLPKGKTYYASVRGVNTSNEETVFSPEVSVEIGNPSTASAMITTPLELLDTVSPNDVAPENPLAQKPLADLGGTVTTTTTTVTEVPGKSGAPEDMLLFILASAAIGTIVALRRQCIAVIAQK